MATKYPFKNLRGRVILLDVPQRKDSGIQLSAKDEDMIMQDAVKMWNKLTVYAVGDKVEEVKPGDKVYIRTSSLNMEIVERIDIILGKTRSGSVIKGGFVHFKEMRWYNTSWVNIVRETIQKEGMFKARHNIFGQFTFMYNTKPVAATPLNIHQLADALSLAEIAINKSNVLNTKLSDELLQSRKNEENLLLQIKTRTDELNRQKSLSVLLSKSTPI